MFFGSSNINFFSVTKASKSKVDVDPNATRKDETNLETNESINNEPNQEQKDLEEANINDDLNENKTPS
jgi:hypothetical protein